MFPKRTLKPFDEVERGSRSEGTPSRLLARLSSFNRREDGLEAVEAIIIIFVAVIILIALLNYFFPEVFEQLKSRINELLSPR